MKAKEVDGRIKIFNRLPSKYVSEIMNIAGGFHLLPIEIHEAEGFFDLIEPAFDPAKQRLGDIYFDDVNEVFTYSVEDIVFNLEDLKNGHRQVVKQVICEMSGLISSIKNIYDPFRTNPENIPEEFKNLLLQLMLLRDRADTEISGLATIDEALNYVVRGPEIERYITQLKSFL